MQNKSENVTLITEYLSMNVWLQMQAFSQTASVKQYKVTIFEGYYINTQTKVGILRSWSL